MKPFAVLGAICVAVWAFLFLAYPTYTHRYRLTIEIGTPDGVRSASSVMQASRLDRGYLPLPGRRYEIEFKGDAVLVDLGSGKSVIATLGFGAKSEDEDQIRVLALKAWDLHPGTEGWKAIESRSGSVQLTGVLIPTIVTFDDLSDPKSAKIVYAATGPRRGPVIAVDRLAELFGPQTSFHSARLEVTDDSVTRGIEKKLPWLPHPQYLSGRFGCAPSEPHCLHGGHFKR